uniref:Uncharacterized protein n=2 Tax=Panagrolaimus sp. JU765 TaxID=591449 RepID=A0AC34RD19_9BILA
METIKCVLIGDSGVGKSALIHTYVKNGFRRGYIPGKLEDGVHETIAKGLNNKRYILQIQDTEGKSVFDLVRPFDYADANVFLICFSIVSPASFKNVELKWIRELIIHCPKIPFILVGTKFDLIHNPGILKNLEKTGQKPITFEEAAKYGNELNAKG